MTINSKQTRSSWFEQTIPARLSRSKPLAWLMLTLVAATISFGYLQKHEVVQALQRESMPSIASGLNLEADYQYIDAQLQASLVSRQNESAADYEGWNQKTVRDIEQAMRITSPGGTSAGLTRGLPEAVDITVLFEHGYVDYRESADAVRTDIARGDINGARLDYAASKRTLSNEVYPTTQQLYTTGTKGMQSAAVSYRSGLTLSNDALFVLSFLLLAFLTWQYVFILKNCKIILQGTALALLFSMAAVAWTYQCDRTLNTYFDQAYHQEFSQLQLAQPFAAAGSYFDGNKVVSAADASKASTVSPQLAVTTLQHDISKAAACIAHLLAVSLALLFAAGLSYSRAVVRASMDFS